MRNYDRRRKSSDANSQEEQFEARTPQSQPYEPKPSTKTATGQWEKQRKVLRTPGRKKHDLPQMVQVDVTREGADEGGRSKNNATEFGEAAPAKETRRSGRQKIIAPQEEASIAASEGDAQLKEDARMEERRQSRRKNGVVPQGRLVATPAGIAQVKDISLGNVPQSEPTTSQTDLRRSSRRKGLVPQGEQPESGTQGGASAHKLELAGNQRETLSATEVVEEQHMEYSAVTIQPLKQAPRVAPDLQAQEPPRVGHRRSSRREKAREENEIRQLIPAANSQEVVRPHELTSDEAQNSQQNIQPEPPSGGEETREQILRSLPQQLLGCQNKALNPVEKGSSNQTSVLISPGIPVFSPPSTAQSRQTTPVGFAKTHQHVSSPKERPSLTAPPIPPSSELTASNEALQVQRPPSSMPDGLDPSAPSGTQPSESIRPFQRLSSSGSLKSTQPSLSTLLPHLQAPVSLIQPSETKSSLDPRTSSSPAPPKESPHSNLHAAIRVGTVSTASQLSSNNRTSLRELGAYITENYQPMNGFHTHAASHYQSPYTSHLLQHPFPSKVDASGQPALPVNLQAHATPQHDSPNISQFVTSPQPQRQLQQFPHATQPQLHAAFRQQPLHPQAVLQGPSRLLSSLESHPRAQSVTQTPPEDTSQFRNSSTTPPVPHSQQFRSRISHEYETNVNHQQIGYNARGSGVAWHQAIGHKYPSEPLLQSVEVAGENINQGPARGSRGAGRRGGGRAQGGTRGFRKILSDTRALGFTGSPSPNNILDTNLNDTYDGSTSRESIGGRGRGRGRGMARGGRGKPPSDKRATSSVLALESPAPKVTLDVNGEATLKVKTRAPRGGKRGRPRGSGRGSSAGRTRSPSAAVPAALKVMASSGQGSLVPSGAQVSVQNNTNLYGNLSSEAMAALDPAASFPTRRVLLPRPTLEQARQQFESETSWAREMSRESSGESDFNFDQDDEDDEEGESELGSEDQSEEEDEEEEDQRIDDGFISDADSVEDEIQASEEKIARELAKLRGEAHVGRKHRRQMRIDGKYRNVHRGPRKAKELTGDLKMRIGKATKLFLEQDYQGAMKLVDETIGLNAETFEAWTLKASLYKERGDIESAIESLYIGAHFRHREVEPWFYCAAYCLEETGDLRPFYLKKAKMCFAKALISQGDNLFALFSRADLYMETLGFQPALNTYARILNRHRKHDLRALRGVLESAIGLENASSKALKDGTTAVAIIEAEIKTLRDDPDEFEFNELVYRGTDDGTTNPNALFGWDFVVLYAELIMVSNQYHNALKNTKSLARLLVGREEENFWDEVSKNDCEWDMDDTRRFTVPKFEAGLHSIEAYSTELPVEIRVKLGVCRLFLHEEEEAMRHFKWLDSLQVEEKPHLWWEIADALYKSQKFATALTFYEPLLLVPEECTAVLHLQLGNCYLERNIDAEAEKHFQQAADLDKFNTEARGHLAKLFEKRGEKTLALNMSNLVKQLMLEQALPKIKKQGRKPWDDDGLPFVRKLIPLAPRPTTELPILKPAAGYMVSRSPASHTVPKPRLMPAPEKNARSEEQMNKHLEVQYNLLCKERNRMRTGNLDSITAYLEAAKTLTEDFRRVKALYPADKALKFAGYSASESKQASVPLAQDMLDMATRLSQQLGANVQERSNRLPPGISDTYRGMPFTTWLDLFMEYAICLAKKRELRKCYEVCQAAKDCIVFYHSRDDMFVLHLCWSMCALMLNDLDTVVNLAKFFLTEYQFTTDTYRLFAVLARACRGTISWYNAGPTQQFLLKQIRLMDYSVTPESEKASIPANNRAKYTAVDKDGKIIIPDDLDLSLLMLYGYMLSLGSNYTEALHYFIRAWAVDPDNAMINLTIGLTHIHLALTSQSENRQHSILQALTFVFRYYDTRKESRYLEERLEAHHNVARTYHTLGLSHLAIPYYWKVLNEANGDDKQDLAMNSAYNLQTLYSQAGNLELAKSVAKEFLVI